MVKTKTKSKDTYFEGIGRRKTSTARVRIRPATKGSFVVNGVSVSDYFKTEEEKRLIQDPMAKTGAGKKWSIEVKVSGGGHHSQAEAVRHGLARALIKQNEELKSDMKEIGFLTRDSRAKERRKFGLKKARKAPQWSKR